MSDNSVDQRIVDMRFNNRQFESGIQDSLSSLEKLKQGLNLKDAAKGLSGLGETAKRFSLAGVAEGVDAIASKFTALGIMGVTALQNITNSAVNAGKRIVSALTIEPVKQGFSEYELKMGSIQTIMAGTGASLDEVNKKLGELNEYSDKTIYSFADMTTNIGKFTNAGVSLDNAVAAIQGVSNVAAVSGANANEASRAMYNFAQALSSGYIKLIDWKSIELANMGTVEFKQQLIDAAVAAGTLKVATNGMYKTVKGNLVNATKGFNDSLQDQWMTTEVLVGTLNKYADETTDIGKKAFAAAQDIKTLTQMYDTLKESAGSGWAQTWELISGNFDEAKALYTELGGAIGGIINRSSDARNAMLQMWKDEGGREALIQSFRNAFSAVGALLKPVQEAFRDVFPPTTGKRLAQLTENLKQFTEKLKIGDETAAKIRRTFKGVFSILNIGKQAFFGLASGAKSLITFFLPAAKGLLTFTASIGDWVTGTDAAIKKAGTFNKIFGKLSSVITDSAKKVQAAGKRIAASLQLKGLDLSGIDALVASIKAKFKPFDGIGAMVSKSISAISKVTKKLGPTFSAIGKKIGETVGNINFGVVFSIFSSGAFVGLLAGLKKLIDSFRSISDSAGGFVGGLKDILDGVKDSLTAYQNDLKAGTLIKIAGAIGILAAALLILSLVDSNKLTASIGAITVLFAELMGSMSIFDKVAKNMGMSSMVKVTGLLIGISVAILIMASAVAALAKLDLDQLAVGLLGVSVIIAALVGAAELLSKSSGGLAKSSAGLILFAIALRIISGAIESLAELDTDQLIRGIAGVVAACATLALFLAASKLGSVDVKTGAGLMAIALAVRILASAVEAFGTMDSGALNAGLMALLVVLGQILAFTKFVGNGKNLISTGAGLMLLGAAMMIFASAVEKFGSLPADVLAAGLVSLGLALTAVTIALRFMPKNMLGIGLGMLAMSAGLILMAKAISVLGSMNDDELSRGLTGLATALLALTIAVKSMNGSLAGAAALTVVSAALIGLAFAMRLIGAMPLGDIVKALFGIAAVLAVLGVAALVMAPIVPTMFLLGGALIIMGAGLAAIGGAALILGIGLSALTVAGLAGVGILLALVAAIVPLTVLAPAILVVAAALTIFAVGISAVGLGFMLLATGLGLIVALGPAGLEALVALADTASKVAEFALELLVAGAGLLLFGTGALFAGAGALVAAIGIAALGAGLKVLGEADISNMIGIGDLAEDLLKASLALLLAAPGLAAGGAALNKFGSGAKKTGEGLSTITNGIMAVMTSLKTVPTDVSSVGDSIISTVNRIIEAINASVSGMKTDTVEAVSDVLDASIEAIEKKKPDYITSGVNLVTGFISGIQSRSSAAASAAAEMAASALRAVNSTLQINSPSKVFAVAGMYSDMGFAKGLKDYSYLAANAAEKVGTNTVSRVIAAGNKEFKDSSFMVDGLQRAAQSAMSINPTVTSTKSVTMRHTFDTLVVEGVNNEGEFVAAADYSVEEMLTSLMRRQSRV